ncbi:MAG: type IV pilus twitching motility protein PilT [Armatimonadota bacterium]|nr:type IV pilus twitching motility protein PilT [Armatimonadota bacterium]
MATIDELLTITVKMDASDLHLKADSPPLVRKYGDLNPLDMPALTRDEVRELAFSVLTPDQVKKFEDEWEFDAAYEIAGLARFRVNLFVQRGDVGVVFRVIPLRIQTMEELGLPPVCKYFAERPRGLVLVTGPAGSGKSTTQAAMIDYINKNNSLHVMTIEDPVEFVHDDIRCLINQRQLDIDTLSFANALKYVLRQDPDVILVGEMRDLETIALAITAAETGHLVFGTLHTTDAVQTVDRIIDVFPMYQQQQIRMQLAVNLIGVISQTLVKRADGVARVAAFETLVAIPSIRNLIREAKTFQIASMIQTGLKQGMMTLDQYLAGLVKKGIVTFQEAESKATNVIEFRALLERETVT